MPWTVCQIGARENYSVARALERRNALGLLITDAWCPPNGLICTKLGRIRERNHPELSPQIVWAPTWSSVVREVRYKFSRRSSWAQIEHRNGWFQGKAVQRLKQVPPDQQITVFAYSYAAAEIFAYAKSRGWQTVLGQIDPGPVEARLVERLYADAGQSEQHEHIPETYWENWRRETALSDWIAVNSDWSRQGLVDEGVPDEKIVTVPLAYEGRMTRRCHITPKVFDASRPLRMLFLGQVTLRKGIDIALEAMRLLPNLPLQLDIVGPLQINLPEWVNHDRRIVLHGGVPRSKVEYFYADADLFLFPTRSDGFGLTQLEAMSAGVPIIASRNCGNVVEDGVNGVILKDLSAEVLAFELDALINEPSHLEEMRSNSEVDTRFDLDNLSNLLSELSTKNLPKSKVTTKK